MSSHKKNNKGNTRPTVIDLFSGVGGMSLGAARAGFNIAAAVDTDSVTLATHARNFPNAIHIARTVRTLTGSELISLATLRSGELDGLVGGPPCQGFSVIGYKSREDRRNDLFAHFFRLVAETKPRFYLAENVPGILTKSYEPLRRRAFDLVRDDYVSLSPIKICASDYGAPTIRTRIFFVGYRKDFGKELTESSFAAPKVETVKVREALRGLPIRVDDDWQTEEKGWRPIGKLEDTRYLNKMRGQIPKGVGDSAALDRYLERRQVSGCLGTAHARDVRLRFSRLEPGEKDLISKAVRLDPKGFCPTLRAGTGSDRGSYQAVRPIHHREPRVITPREAARLQGFPDWFQFHPTKWHSFRQLGNSVSPIVSEFLLRRLVACLT